MIVPHEGNGIGTAAMATQSDPGHAQGHRLGHHKRRICALSIRARRHSKPHRVGSDLISYRRNGKYRVVAVKNLTPPTEP
jgi:hypothetical protein